MRLMVIKLINDRCAREKYNSDDFFKISSQDDDKIADIEANTSLQFSFSLENIAF